MGLILVVDDEPDACQLMQRILAALGYEVSAYANPAEALHWLQTNAPDLVLLDVELGRTSGADLLEVIRRCHTSAKVVMMTGYPFAESAVKMMQIGVEDYLLKPVEVEELEKTVTALLPREDPK